MNSEFSTSLTKKCSEQQYLFREVKEIVYETAMCFENFWNKQRSQILEIQHNTETICKTESELRQIVFLSANEDSHLNEFGLRLTREALQYFV